MLMALIFETEIIIISRKIKKINNDTHVLKSKLLWNIIIYKNFSVINSIRRF